MSPRAPFVELFCSFQGEGPIAGVRQAFLRLAGCPLRCNWCDTSESHSSPTACRVEDAPRSGRFTRQPNPLDLNDLTAWMEKVVLPWDVHSVSVTGGEPLIHGPFLEDLLPAIQGLGLQTYLDTAGTPSSALETIETHVDRLALDLKLPTCSGARVPPEDARRSLAVAARRDGFVKIVLTKSSLPSELEEAVRLMARTAPALPLILQPVTAPEAFPEASLETFRSIAEKHLSDITILPQLHPLAGWK